MKIKKVVELEIIKREKHVSKFDFENEINDKKVLTEHNTNDIIKTVKEVNINKEDRKCYRLHHY